jgi:hypothetical protein
MIETSVQTLEGRLIAQRKVLARLVASSPRAWRVLEQPAPFQDHEEDPSVVPSSAYAIEAAAAEELRLIAEDARRFRDEAEAAGTADAPMSATGDANPEAVPPRTAGAGENACRRCHGTGVLAGGRCPDCGGTGIVTTGLAGG